MAHRCLRPAAGRRLHLRCRSAASIDRPPGRDTRRLRRDRLPGEGRGRSLTRRSLSENRFPMAFDGHRLGFDTLQLHAGQEPDGAVRARAVPIHQTTSFVFEDFEQAAAVSAVETFGFDYTRITNPTNEVLENRIAALEGGSAALSVASGSAATAYSVLNLSLIHISEPTRPY